MNKQGRKTIAEVTKVLGYLTDADALARNPDDWIKRMLETAESAIAELAADEQEKFDNLPEGLQQSERGQVLEDTAYTLESMNFDLSWSRDEEDWADDLAAEVQELIDELENLE